MKKSLLRAWLLVCAVVLGFAQSWALGTVQVPVKMTYIDGGNADAAAGQVEGPVLLGYMKWSNNQVACGNAGWGCNNVAYLEVDASAVEGVITNVKLDAVFDEATGGKRNVEVQACYNDSEWSDALTWNTADRSLNWLASFTVDRGKGAGQAGSFDLTKAFTGEKKKVTILMFGMAAAGATLTAVPTVTVSYATADEITTYTVKYVDEDGNELKKATVHEGQMIGSTVAATAEEMAAFKLTAEDGTVTKWICKDTEAPSIELVADGASNVITLTFKKAALANVLVQVNGMNYKTYENIFDGDDFTFWMPYYMFMEVTPEEGEPYQGFFKLTDDKKSYGQFTVTVAKPARGSNMAVNIAYTEEENSNAVFYAEAEDIETLTKFQDGFTEIRMSNGAVAYAAEDGAVITHLPAGRYSIESSTRSAKTGITFKAGEQEILTMTSEGAVTTPTAKFTLAEEADITVSAGSESVYFDYVLIRDILAAENEAAAAADMAWWEGLCTELTAIMVPENYEFITADTRQAIEEFMKEDNYPSAIQAAWEDANEGKTVYVCPFDKAQIEAQVRGWIAEINAIKNGELPIYTEAGVVSNGTSAEDRTAPFWNTAVNVEVYNVVNGTGKVTVKAWDGVEGSDLTIYYNSINVADEGEGEEEGGEPGTGDGTEDNISYVISGIEQTVNGEVVSTPIYDDEDVEIIGVNLEPQAGCGAASIDLMSEDNAILVGEGGGMLRLMGNWATYANGILENAPYMVIWPGEPVEVLPTLGDLVEIAAGLDMFEEVNIKKVFLDGDKITYFADEQRQGFIENADAAFAFMVSAAEAGVEGLATGKALTGVANVTLMENLGTVILQVNSFDGTIADANVKEGREVSEFNELLIDANESRLLTVNSSKMCQIVNGEDGVVITDGENQLVVVDMFYGLGDDYEFPEIIKSITGIIYNVGMGTKYFVPRSADDIVAGVAPVAVPEYAKYFWAANADGDVTEVGGMIEANEAAAADGRLNYSQAGYNTICLNGAKDFSTAYMTVTLDEPLAEGDIIYVTAFRNKNAEGKSTGAKFRFGGDDSNTLVTGDGETFNNIHPNYATGDGKPNQVAITVTAAQAGCTTFDITRQTTGTNLFITELYIKDMAKATVINNATVNTTVNGAVYNLAGQKVSSNFKGIVVKNGKKVMVK